MLPAGSAEPHRGRRERVLAALSGGEGGALVLTSGPVLHRSGDSDLPYRPDSDLLYLSGWREPDSVLVLRGFADEARAVLFVRDRDPARELWDGIRMGPAAAREWVGVDEAYPIQELEARLPGLLAGADRLWFRLGRDPRAEALVVRALTDGRRSRARNGHGPMAVLDPGVLLDPMRVRKDAGEIALLREAARLTARGLRDASEQTRPGMGEWEVQAIVEGGWRRAGAEGPAFGTIVGSGPNGCILHYRENARVIEAGDLVLVDCGAEYGDYAGDMTRTFPASGRFSPEQAALHATVDGARLAAIAAVRPGVTFQEIHRIATRHLVDGLVAAGVLTGEPAELIERGEHTRFFPHRTSHWLGLDVHDPGATVLPGGGELPLEPGMVLTIEPGLYIPPGAEGGAAPFAGIGIRIEDDILVTADGHEVLGGGEPVG